jgi:uncharacterized protein with HEPN domain
MDRDIGIVYHIIAHIENIIHSQERFGDGLEVFKKDTDYFNSVCMSLLQIGELANHLSDNFLTENNSIPWKQIIGLRNVVVHGYGQIDSDVVWTTIQEDIPELLRQCKEIAKA